MAAAERPQREEHLARRARGDVVELDVDLGRGRLVLARDGLRAAVDGAQVAAPRPPHVGAVEGRDRRPAERPDVEDAPDARVAGVDDVRGHLQ